MKVLVLQNGLPVSVDIAVGTVYSESILFSTGLAANTAITLPGGETFSDPDAKDLLVIANDLVMESGRNFNVLGTTPFTQIEFIYDLPNNSVVVFRKNI